MSRVEGIKSRVEGKMSRVPKNVQGSKKIEILSSGSPEKHANAEPSTVEFIF